MSTPTSSPQQTSPVTTARLSQPAPCPIACRQVYERRCAGDPLYAVLSSNNAAVLNPHVSGIMQLIERRGTLRSVTMKTFQRVLASNDTIAKHAIILMALHAEPAFREYWAERGNERVVAEYTLNVLPKYVQAVLTGHFENMKTFVREVRSEYMMM
jgi:hypothetical protein